MRNYYSCFEAPAKYCTNEDKNPSISFFRGLSTRYKDASGLISEKPGSLCSEFSSIQNPLDLALFAEQYGSLFSKDEEEIKTEEDKIVLDFNRRWAGDPFGLIDDNDLAKTFELPKGKKFQTSLCEAEKIFQKKSDPFSSGYFVEPIENWLKGISLIELANLLQEYSKQNIAENPIENGFLVEKGGIQVFFCSMQDEYGICVFAPITLPKPYIDYLEDTRKLSKRRGVGDMLKGLNYTTCDSPSIRFSEDGLYVGSLLPQCSEDTRRGVAHAIYCELCSLHLRDIDFRFVGGNLSIYAPNLLSMIWLDFALGHEGLKGLGICENCGAIFTKDNPGQKKRFHSDLCKKNWHDRQKANPTQ